VSITTSSDLFSPGPAAFGPSVDRDFMAAALSLAQRGLGRTWPNPSVGCLLVRFSPTGGAGRVVGRGFTQPGGRPHAETQALAQAGALAKGATAYVTLEPCSHHGKTPPCAEALIEAGVARCVVAATDPDPRVSGRGLARLREAGIEVVEGVLQHEAEALNAGFFLRVMEGRPLVTLKLATSLDGRIATHSGESRWITGPAARAYGHWLRAEHDAILVGANTAIADDPELTCRLPGCEDRHPVRIVLDSHLRLPLTHKLVATARQVPLWLICAEGNERARLAAFSGAGVEVIEVARDSQGGLSIDAVLSALGARGLTRLLVEGGGHVAAAFLRRDRVDCLVWFHAPMVIGGDGLPALQGFGVDHLRDAVRDLGGDLVEIYRRNLINCQDP